MNNRDRRIIVVIIINVINSDINVIDDEFFGVIEVDRLHNRHQIIVPDVSDGSQPSVSISPGSNEYVRSIYLR